MEILIFALFFGVITSILYKSTDITGEKEPEFDLSFVKGTTRGSIGMITSMSAIEELREKLSKKNSKF